LKTASATTPAGAPDQDGTRSKDDAGPAEDTLAAGPDPATFPTAPWTSWAQVWQVREALKEHRGLLLSRQDHLSEKQQDTITLLVDGPLADLVGVARRFLPDCYAIWRAEDGQRRPLVEAQERYERWHANPD
jgi:2,4-dienoyl-CoA reductase-like NADH-dependent reductase (Old Yellow Enzyme family)